MPATEPIAVLGDTLMLVAALLAARWAIVAAKGAEGWSGWVAIWLRRVAVVSILLLALRLVTIAANRPEIAAPVSGFIAMILFGGIAALVADHWIVRLIETRARRS
ncbi:hypothetical protein [Sphingomonas sp. G-3-2-10]|uniref:hypothetical protein n=1 Tax=Sphingomonas sp. G-3-2-10 TaxID=2728838 RepID=UPI00146C563C|nr:hypothetical protein [Sphingomonas sp. G-3-2-10]NML06992.1 hypothetical protein [Sphingomonas sp. G-3-2-10]